jgi:hypothetical protein
MFLLAISFSAYSANQVLVVCRATMMHVFAGSFRRE